MQRLSWHLSKNVLKKRMLVRALSPGQGCVLPGLGTGTAGIKPSDRNTARKELVRPVLCTCPCIKVAASMPAAKITPMMGKTEGHRCKQIFDESIQGSLELCTLSVREDLSQPWLCLSALQHTTHAVFELLCCVHTAGFVNV